MGPGAEGGARVEVVGPDWRGSGAVGILTSCSKPAGGLRSMSRMAWRIDASRMFSLYSRERSLPAGVPSSSA